MHLAEPGFQPAGLLEVQATGRAASQAVGVERDEPHRGRVVDVVGSSVEPVPLAEPVPERPRPGPQVRVDEVPPADRPPEGIRRDVPGRTRHERLGITGEELKCGVMIEAGRQPDRLPAARQRGGQPGRLDTDALVEGLMIAEAG